MATTPLPHPPATFRPDRFELIQKVGELAPVQLAPGILFDCLIGQHNGARNLTTGELYLSANTQLGFHSLPVGESITLISGAATISAEGREYPLAPLDNITIPRGLPHAIYNGSRVEPARLHRAIACASPVHEWVSIGFESGLMSAISAGVPGKEHVTRFNSAPRSEAGPGTSFIDHFNQDLIPGFEMSGGYGLFSHGGRLPAHFHDFDESICIIQGTATCIVEGRRYQMSDGSTALQPRGRVHYFINDCEEPMAMLWVYAGPLPQRIVADDRCATAEGNPWK